MSSAPKKNPTGRQRGRAGRLGKTKWIVFAIVPIAVIVAVMAFPLVRVPKTEPVANAAEYSVETNSQATATNGMADAAPDPLAFEDEFDRDKSMDALNRGNELLAEGKVEDAVREYRLAVKYNPEDEDTYYNLAVGLARAGMIDEAIEQYKKSLEIYPDYVEARNNLGNLYAKQGKFGEAVEQFQEALTLEPEKPTVHNNLGNALARGKRIAEAVPHFHMALQIEPDYTEARLNLANAYLMLRDYEKAEAEFITVLQAHPRLGLAHAGLAKARQGKQTLNR